VAVAETLSAWPSNRRFDPDATTMHFPASSMATTSKLKLEVVGTTLVLGSAKRESKTIGRKEDEWFRKNPGAIVGERDYWTAIGSPDIQKCYDEASKVARDLHWNNAWQVARCSQLSPFHSDGYRGGLSFA
jgi:hypothetical protein